MRGFESKAHEQEIWECIKRGTVPLKFAFAGDAAETHDELGKSEEYHENITSIKVEKDILQGIGSDLQGYDQICEMGPGNGYHTITLLDIFENVGHLPDDYLALDFSNDLLEIAIRRIEDQYPTLVTGSEAWDFEKRPTNAIQEWRSEDSILALFVGSTLSNMASPVTVFNNFRESLTDNDLLLIEVALWNDPSTNELLDGYRTDVFRNAALEPLLMAGIDEDSGRFELFLDRDERTVYGEFVFDKEFKLSYEGESLQFNPGSKIICFQSKRFLDAEVRSLLSDSGWCIVDSSISSNNTYGAYLCQIDS